MVKRKSNRNTLPKERKEFEEEVIAIDRVTRVVKGGRRLRFRATVVIGDKKGRVGIGIGKSNEVTGAISKAITKAKKTLITIPMVNGTIPHEIKHKFKAAKILLMPAAPGTGIIAGGSIRKVINLAGVTNIMGKSFGSNNKLSTTRAAFEALKLLKENPFIKQNAEVTKIVKEEVEVEMEDIKTKEVKKAAPKKTTHNLKLNSQTDEIKRKKIN
ncbi:MAG: 30S ribosomal protein S5 [Candidatus Peregrinibacteria bacterium]|nr:30S ribosomal protein S5 [Candidatus Peregrinibacteria bacterium]MDZ4245414.1 30S ribosomal protein S5 [Candidatus Gracilibacteria bacterium]